MDMRAKQRLTGAVILVALFVLLVPELLTGPGSSGAPADTPPAEEGLREYTIDLGDTRSARTEPATPPPSAVNLPPVESPSAEPGSGLAVPGEEAAPAREVSPPPPPATNPMSAPAPAPRAEPAREPPAQPRTPAVRAEPGTFVVQLGSFGSRENADRLVRDMKAKGFAAFIAPITSNGRELYRVRVGPTRDRASAESLAADLKRVGQSGAIVPIS